MKKVLIVVSAFVLLAAAIGSIASWFWAGDAVATSAAKPWPAGMGTLESATSRYPPQQANEASRKLIALASALPRSEAVDAFVQREITRGELAIGERPTTPDTTAMRDLLLQAPIVWQREEGIGGDGGSIDRRATQMNAARHLIAGALKKARANDPEAWDELHAVWKLARSLDGHPQMMSQTAALTMARMINAIAWKMPLPTPEWFADLQKRDNVQPLLEAFQHQSASYWQSGAEMFPTKWLAASVEHDRAIAEEVAKATACDVKTRMNQLGTDLTSVWRRAFRYRAEREATANALRIRLAQPIETQSVCSDGTWAFDQGTLRFSREIPSSENDWAMPLALRVQADLATTPAEVEGRLDGRVGRNLSLRPQQRAQRPSMSASRPPLGVRTKAAAARIAAHSSDLAGHSSPGEKAMYRTCLPSPSRNGKRSMSRAPFSKPSLT